MLAEANPPARRSLIMLHLERSPANLRGAPARARVTGYRASYRIRPISPHRLSQPRAAIGPVLARSQSRQAPPQYRHPLGPLVQHKMQQLHSGPQGVSSRCLEVNLRGPRLRARKRVNLAAPRWNPMLKVTPAPQSDGLCVVLKVPTCSHSNSYSGANHTCTLSDRLGHGHMHQPPG